jgi:hypothetical protein
MIVSNSDVSELDNSAKKLQCAVLLKFKPHYVQQISVRFVSEAWVSLLFLPEFVGDVDDLAALVIIQENLR